MSKSWAQIRDEHRRERFRRSMARWVTTTEDFVAASQKVSEAMKAKFVAIHTTEGGQE